MFCHFVCCLFTLSLYHYLLAVVHPQTSQAIKPCYSMSKKDKKYLDDECDKIDFMSIVKSVGSQIKVSTVDTRVLNEKFLIHISCKMHDQLLSVSKRTICSVSIGFDLNVNSCEIYTMSVCDHT